MKIIDLLDKNSISLVSSPSSKKEALEEAIELVAKSGKIIDKDVFSKKVFAREEQGTTGVGDGIAIPHGKCAAVKEPALSAMVVEKGVDFDSLDDKQVNLIFLIAAPDTEDNVHLDVLSKLSVLLLDEIFVENLKKASTADEFLSIIDEAETKINSVESLASKPEASIKDSSVRILAVTSCPTGIAHTYMAAENLIKAAKKRNLEIKVETRGSGGAKNVLTDSEISSADFIIIAADTQVPMERFDGKKIFETQVSDGINKAEELIELAIKGNGKIYKSSSASRNKKSSSSGTIGHRIYMQLMNGVSHMLPFVVGGGILIAIAFLLDGMGIDINSLSPEQRSSFGSITPLAATFMKIGGVAFGFMLPILAGFIAMSIGDRPALAVGFVGGMIASSGSSGFLGALAAGFLAGYLVLLLKAIFSILPETIEKIAPVLLYPLFGILAIGFLMIYIVEPPIGALNTGLNETLTNMSGGSKILLGFVLGGMMAIDMGGPFNKAAYVFGTASIAAGNYDIMAAVMIGGMVPPMGIALSTVLFKDKYTEDEKKAGPVNFIMGLSFITEGAIPFAASDPFRVLPSCIIGSAISGALSMAFGAQLMAPHGGIFVFPVVTNSVMYLVSLLVGTFVSAFLLGVLKKKVEN